MAAQIAKRNIGTTIVLPRTLRAEVQIIQDKAGVSLGEIARVALARYVREFNENVEMMEVEAV